MIYTVTLNPSIDYIVRLEQLHLGEVNRMDEDFKFPGGKGINVSRILNRIQVPNTAFGLIGGFTGQFINDILQAEGTNTEFITIQDDTRINVKIKAEMETEINGKGPKVTKEEQEALKKQMKQLTKEDVVVLAGSVPPALSQGFYEELIQLIKEAGASFVIDTTGKDLMTSLSYQPLLVKPNNHELAELFNTSFATQEEIYPYAEKLLAMGAKHVLISMAGDGALYFHENKRYFAQPLKGELKNSVGAGDSMIAGFIGGLEKTNDPLEAFKMGVACGSATAFSDDLADEAFIQKYLKQVKITEL